MKDSNAWKRGLRKLGPGVYIDETSKTLQISENELCDYFGVPYTSANFEVIEKAAIDAVEQIFGQRIRTIRVRQP